MTDDMNAILNPADQQDDFTALLREMGEGTYIGVKRLPDGSYAVLIRLLFTRAIALGADEMSWKRRFCYDDLAECLHNWQRLQSQDDEPTGWIARRPKDED